ncbi:hypothetical protein BDK51DRAFT_29597 [Blyttiomyces helicus]|uniref:DUF5808 domain-containing protein n=1 Tax=Blyttiomyces helicus TaxID=388810 RepID=A0A4P9WRL7_9FUNG|nr:hypothetical protein BDK51DRAFT_29597 [Blyttiomyces helicus]|eukprot:RKO94528.1 hypothetical protein BDK51DRAFT_29597 [Blyttiomyces helicus]
MRLTWDVNAAVFRGIILLPWTKYLQLETAGGVGEAVFFFFLLSRPIVGKFPSGQLARPSSRVCQDRQILNESEGWGRECHKLGSACRWSCLTPHVAEFNTKGTASYRMKRTTQNVSFDLNGFGSRGRGAGLRRRGVLLEYAALDDTVAGWMMQSGLIGVRHDEGWRRTRETEGSFPRTVLARPLARGGGHDELLDALANDRDVSVQKLEEVLVVDEVNGVFGWGVMSGVVWTERVQRRRRRSRPSDSFPDVRAVPKWEGGTTTGSREHLKSMWENPANWNLHCIYSCKDDPRFFVPKRLRIGWTINFAKRTPEAKRWMEEHGAFKKAIKCVVKGGKHS